jgi:hypothetical protein
MPSHRSTVFALAAAFGMFSGLAYAQDEEVDAETGRKVIYKQKTEIDFEGVEVAGELVKPQGALLLDRKRASFNPLIKLRTNFDEEMALSVDEVK